MHVQAKKNEVNIKGMDHGTRYLAAKHTHACKLDKLDEKTQNEISLNTTDLKDTEFTLKERMSQFQEPINSPKIKFKFKFQN